MGEYLNREDLSHQVFLEFIQACDFNQMALNGPFRDQPVSSPTPTAVGPFGTTSLWLTRKLFKPRSWEDKRDRRQIPSQTFAGSQSELEVGTEVGDTAKKWLERPVWPLRIDLVSQLSGDTAKKWLGRPVWPLRIDLVSLLSFSEYKSLQMRHFWRTWTSLLLLSDLLCGVLGVSQSPASPTSRIFHSKWMFLPCLHLIWVLQRWDRRLEEPQTSLVILLFLNKLYYFLTLFPRLKEKSCYSPGDF